MSFINKMNIGNVSYDIQAGEKMQLTFPAGATNGTLTDEQLATLNTNYQSCIEMVNDKELYYLNDNGHVDGYLTYSHVGVENSKPTIKTLTITLSTKSFVIVPTDAGGKLYRYDIELQYVTVSTETWSCNTYIYDTEEIETFTIDMLKSKLPKVTNAVLMSDVGWGFFGSIYYPTSTSNKIQFRGDAINNETTPVGQSYYLEIDVDACTIKRVTKTEL